MQPTDYLISDARPITVPAIRYLCARSAPTPFDDLDTVLDPLIDALYAARRAPGIVTSGPDITRYYPVDRNETPGGGLYIIEFGVAVPEGTPLSGRAQVLTLPPFRCASLLLWGSLAHIAEAHESLRRSVSAAGLEPTGENREINYCFESIDSPNNLIGLCMGVR